jgi:hypothetical protein
MTAVIEEGARRSFGTVLTDTNETVVYECPAGATATYLTWLNVSDDAADARTITLRWTDASAAATYTLIFQATIAANAQTRIELDLVLDAGDTLKATASAAGMHVVVTGKEFVRRKS